MSEHVTYVDYESRQIAEHEFKLTGLETPIRIKLWKDDGAKRIRFTQSHHLHAPGQDAPYHTSLPYGDNEEEAVAGAISGFTMFYGAAIRAGHQPDRSWLVPNPNF